MPILESSQHHHDGGRYTNPSDHPAERRDEEFVCFYCNKIVHDEGDVCAECQMAEAEYKEER